MSDASQQGPDYQEIIQHLLENDNYPKLLNNHPHDFFSLAEYIPPSLNYNLQSNSRVVRKVESGSKLLQTLLRAFYFQLLKLCFQLFDEEGEKNYLEISKSILFDKSLMQNQEIQIHMKHLAEFFQIMENQEGQQYPNFQEIILEHNQIDQAFLAIMGFILTNESQIEQKQHLIQAILNQLCQFFQETLIVNHPYYKFQESEIYILVENSSNVFLVYNDEHGQEISHISRSDQSNNYKGMSSLSNEIKKDEINNYESFSNGFQEQPVKISPIVQKQEKAEFLQRPGSNQSAKSGYFAKIEENPYGKQQVQKESSYYSNNFKKGSERVSSPYDISIPPTSSSLEDKASHYASPTRDIFKPQQKLQQSNLAHNSSNYYDGMYGDITQNNSGHLNTSRSDTIINMFGDMIKSGKFQNSMTEEYVKPKKSIQNTQKILESQQEFQHQNSSDLHSTFAKKLNKADEASILKRAKSVNSVNEHLGDNNSGSIMITKGIEYCIPQKQSFGGPFYNESQNRNFMGLTLQKTQSVMKQQSYNPQKHYQNIETQQIVNFDDEDSIFFKPKRSGLKVINEVTASKETITQRNSEKLDDSKGSIYRQFSDTKILKLLKQPFKTKVQLMRNRFKGQHFNI